MLRTRALSALIFVPVLVIAIVLGLWAIALVLALVALLAAPEVFRLLKSAGYPSLALFGTALAVAFVLRRRCTRLASCVRGSRRRPRRRWGIRPAGPARRAGGLVRHCVRRGVRRPHRLCPPGGNDGPAHPGYGGASGGRLGADPAAGAGCLELRHGCSLVGRQIGRHKFLVHISPSKSIEGLIGGLVGHDRRDHADARGPRQVPGHSAACMLGPLLGLAAQAGDLAEIRAQARCRGRGYPGTCRARRDRLEHINSFLFGGPRRLSEWLRSLADGIRLRVALLGSTGSIGHQTVEVLEHADRFRVVALATGSNAAELDAQAAQRGRTSWPLP